MLNVHSTTTSHHYQQQELDTSEAEQSLIKHHQTTNSHFNFVHQHAPFACYDPMAQHRHHYQHHFYPTGPYLTNMEHHPITLPSSVSSQQIHDHLYRFHHAFPEPNPSLAFCISGHGEASYNNGGLDCDQLTIKGEGGYKWPTTKIQNGKGYAYCEKDSEDDVTTDYEDSNEIEYNRSLSTSLNSQTAQSDVARQQMLRQQNSQHDFAAFQDQECSEEPADDEERRSSAPFHENQKPDANGTSKMFSNYNSTPNNGNKQNDDRKSNSQPPWGWMKKQTYPSVPSSGKTRTKDKYRIVYTELQKVELEKEFLYNQYITIQRKSELAACIGLTDRQVKIWFQNRRAKDRKSKRKREQMNQNSGDHSSPEASQSTNAMFKSYLVPPNNQISFNKSLQMSGVYAPEENVMYEYSDAPHSTFFDAAHAQVCQIDDKETTSVSYVQHHNRPHV